MVRFNLINQEKNDMQVRHYLFLGIAILIGFSATVGVLISTKRHTFQGSLIENPAPAADFELVDQDGQIFRLSEQKGNVVLAFFGYTHCPDVCPVTLSDFGKIRTRLGDRAERVEFVFITTDPERDTPEQINRYLSNFDAEIQGLTGQEQDLEKVWNAYGVYRELVDQQEPENYLVDHTARVYLIDQRGNLRVTYTFGTESEGIAADVSFILKEN